MSLSPSFPLRVPQGALASGAAGRGSRSRGTTLSSPVGGSGLGKSPEVPETQVPGLQGTRVQGAPGFPVITPDATRSGSHSVCRAHRAADPAAATAGGG